MTHNADLDLEGCCSNDVAFSVRSVVASDARTVYLVGELDLHTGPHALAGLVDGADGLPVVVDMSQLCFMDCAGYRAVVAARRHTARHGATLTLAHPHGEPARLLDLVHELGADPPPDTDRIA